MKQAINAFERIRSSAEFLEIERQREIMRMNEASALRHARDTERVKWQGVIAGKDAEIASKDAKLASKDAEIAELRARLKG